VLGQLLELGSIKGSKVPVANVDGGHVEIVESSEEQDERDQGC